MFQLENFKLASGAFCTERLNEQRAHDGARELCESATVLELKFFFNVKPGHKCKFKERRPHLGARQRVLVRNTLKFRVWIKWLECVF